MTSRLSSPVKYGIITGITSAALISAGVANAARPPVGDAVPPSAAAVSAPAPGPAPAPASGQNGPSALASADKAPTLAAPARPASAPAGGSAGAADTVMVPLVPLTAVGGANEDPTAPGAATPSVGHLRLTSSRQLTASITNMDPDRFPVGCMAVAVVNDHGWGREGGSKIRVGIASGESAGAGNAVVLSAPAGAPHSNHVMIDVNCAVKTAVNGRVVTNPHSTHWIGTD